MSEALHFHVNQHDVGYLPDGDVITYLAVDDAIQDVLDRLDSWAEAVSQHPKTMPTRGQPHVDTPWTYGDELKFIEDEADTIDTERTTKDLSLDVALNGMLVSIENGIAVIEIEPCSLQECEEHRDEWVT